MRIFVKKLFSIIGKGLLKNGHVVDEGTYQGLVETNATFRKMARLTT